MQQSWSQFTTAQCGFVSWQVIGTTTHNAFLLEPANSSGSVTPRALDQGFYGIDPEERLYVGGWYSGSGMDAVARDLSTPTVGEDGFVGRLTGTADPWAGQLLGTGDARVLCLESSTDLVNTGGTGFLQRLPIAGEDGLRDGEDEALIVGCGGLFTNTLQYEYAYGVGPVTVGASLGAQDGFIMLFNAESGELLSSVTFGGDDDEAVAVNGLTLSFAAGTGGEVPVIFVTGSFSGTVDFNPNGTAQNKTATGDSDIFVARYRPDDADLVLDWVWTTGATDKQAAGEGIAVFRDGEIFDVFVAGWSDYEPAPNLTNPDVWFARINYDPDGNPNQLTLPWGGAYTLANSSTERAYDIVLDAHNRVVLTGYFAGTLDFDADAGSSDNRTSDDSFDIFVTRYTFSGDYDGTDVFGDGWTEVGYGIDVNQETGQYVYGGYFGGGSSSGYTVDFDPDPNDTASVTGRGGADGFINALDLEVPVVESAIVLVIDASGSMMMDDPGSGDPNNSGECPQDSPFDREIDAVLAAYADIILTDASFVPRDGTVALSAVVFGSQYTDGAMIAVPWITIDSYGAAQSFVDKLNAVFLPGGGTTMADGIELATSLLDDSKVDAIDKIINVIADGIGNSSSAVENARDAALNPQSGIVRLINGVAIDVDDTDQYDILQDFEDHVVGRNSSWPADGRVVCLLAALGEYCACPPSSGPSEFEIYQGIKMIFESHILCKGDITQDCAVDQSDLGILLATYELDPDDPNYNPAADINDDGQVDQSDLGILLAGYDEC